MYSLVGFFADHEDKGAYVVDIKYGVISGIDLGAVYAYTDSLTTSLLYVDSDGDITDTTYGSVLVSYSF